MTPPFNNDETMPHDEAVLVHLLKNIDNQIQNGTLESDGPSDSFSPETNTPDLSDEHQDQLRKSQEALQFINLVREDLKHRSIPSKDADSTINDLQDTIEESPSIPGLKELDRFQIERLIGQGGFAAVFLAVDKLLDRKVALKIPRPHALSSPESIKRFSREAKAAALLSHPSIISIFDAGNVGPIHYLVTDYCPGKNLAQWFKEQNQKVDLKTAVKMIQRLAEAAQHAHQRGVVHRDIKPANILVVDGDQPIEDRLRIVDFGLAKKTDSEDSMVTMDGAIVGTPSYMSPEQARGEKQDSHSGDIFSLGVILYEFLAGTLPFHGENNLAVLKAVESKNPTKPSSHNPGIPRDLDAICLKCLRKSPNDRYKTAFDLAIDLESWLEGRPITARLLSPVEKMNRWISNNRFLSGTLFLLFLSLVTGLSLTTWKWMESETHLATAKKQTERAEKNIQLAQQTIRDMVGKLAEKLKETPKYSAQALSLAKDALNVQKEILKDRPDHTETIFATAQAHFRVASISRLTSQYDEAIHHCRRAILLLSRIEENTESVDNLFLECHWEIAYCNTFLPVDTVNDNSLKVATDFLNTDTIQISQETKNRFLIRFAYIRAHFLTRYRKRAETVECCENALKIFDQFKDESTLMNYRGRLHLIAGRESRLQKKFRPRDFHLDKALEIFNKIHEVHPEDFTILDELADCHFELGSKFQSLKKYKEAIEHYDQSLHYGRSIQESFPNLVSHSSRVNMALLERSSCYLKIGNVKEAVDSFWEAGKKFQNAPNKFKTNLTAYYIGKLAIEIRIPLYKTDSEECKRILTLASEILEPIANSHTHPSYNELYSSCFFSLATIYEYEQNYPEAILLADKALEIIMQRKEIFPNTRNGNYHTSFIQWCRIAARAGRKKDIFEKTQLYIDSAGPSADTHFYASCILSSSAYFFNRPPEKTDKISPELQKTFPKEIVDEAIRHMRTVVELDPEYDYKMFLVFKALNPLRGFKEFDSIVAKQKKNHKNK